MIVPTLTTRPDALALPATDISTMMRATALAIGAIVASSVFSAGWAAADLVLKAL